MSKLAAPALPRADLRTNNKRRIANHVRRVMRHQKKTIKLGRTAEHRKALLANQVCSLIEHQRIKTTLAKAKAVRPLAERMVTLGKNGSIHARRTAFATLRQKNAVKKLFEDIAPRSAERNGGYTRIVKLGQRRRQSRKSAVGLAENPTQTSNARRRSIWLSFPAHRGWPSPQADRLHACFELTHLARLPSFPLRESTLGSCAFRANLIKTG